MYVVERVHLTVCNYTECLLERC